VQHIICCCLATVRLRYNNIIISSILYYIVLYYIIIIMSLGDRLLNQKTSTASASIRDICLFIQGAEIVRLY
jgi:hypothetical protein